jgi:ketosteroid isomerase-like protein
MNRNLLSVVLVAVVMALVLSACQRQADTNSSLTTNRNSTPEPVNTASIEAELIKLERAWAGAAKTRDVATVRNVLADDAVLTYPDGSTGTKNDEVQMVETGAITMESWDIVDPKVTVINPETAFITGRGIIKKGSLKDPKSGNTIDISGEYRFLDVYSKRNGKWQAVASQTTKIANPAPPAPKPAP